MVGGNEVVIGVKLGLMCDRCHPGGGALLCENSARPILDYMVVPAVKNS